MTLETISLNRSHGGVQGVYRHASRETKTTMTFSVFVPPHQAGARLPVVWYLSGLTCTHANVTEKGEFRRACAELGLVFVAPDTSPRGEGVPGDPAGAYDFGLGAGFYVDATRAAIRGQLPHVELCDGRAPRTDRRAISGRSLERQSILGHSMGGHGALTMALAASRPLSRRQRVFADRRAVAGAMGDQGAWAGISARRAQPGASTMPSR